jgi:aminoglycoside phosphotransferase (APT) family kinase protein
MLDPGAVVAYLIERGYLSPKSVVDGAVSIVDVSRRNSNFQVLVPGGPSYLVKSSPSDGTSASLAAEAAAYEFLWSLGEDHGLRGYLARLYQYDAQQNILVLECLQDGESLRLRAGSRGCLPTSINQAMAKGLSLLHKIPVAATGPRRVGRDPEPHAFPMAFRRPTVKELPFISAASLELLRLMQRYPRFETHLDALQEEWKSECLIHGDIRWDNWVVTAAASVRTGRRPPAALKIIDWEAARIGDPRWDVGCVLADYLGLWADSMPVSGDAQPESLTARARYPLERMQPGLRSFWDGYVKDTALGPRLAGAWLRQAVRYAAAKLVQTCFEQAQSMSRIAGTTLASLQLALNILERPDEAIVHLLGFPLTPQGESS